MGVQGALEPGALGQRAGVLKNQVESGGDPDAAVRLLANWENWGLDWLNRAP